MINFLMASWLYEVLLLPAAFIIPILLGYLFMKLKYEDDERIKKDFEERLKKSRLHRTHNSQP